MPLPFTLTLVASRAATTLSAATIAEARELVRGATPALLSPGEAADIPCPAPSDAFGAPDLSELRARFASRHVDVLLARSRNRRKALLVADMDSTIVRNETLDDLAAAADAARPGTGARVAAITARSMAGEIDFASALRERVALLRGLPDSAIETAWAHTRLTDGARTLVATMRAHGATTALVSGGFTVFASRVAAACGFDHVHANTLGVADGVLTGQVAEPVLGRDSKLAVLRSLAAGRNLRPHATLAVGDGANDLDMLRDAGLGVAFRAKPVVASAVPNRVDHADLRALLFAQGYPASAFSD
ncbi:MAG: phosphoserine phosphatase SerB [Gluconacetobacter diazotrophicus]|nr:phosphoserine phosphatase SerB [Gluconacetobacter diazotrophicus]